MAAAISIPHYILNFERQFNEQVVSNFVSEYAAGRTPLPCAHCNSDLKFATLLDRARGLGADAVATGHYARVERTAAGRHELRRGIDASKDQSYFLFALTQDQLAQAVFPVGDRGKDEVRDWAHQRGLPVAAKPDSQEICFIPDHDYAAFVTRHSPRTARAGGRSGTSRAGCWAGTAASTGSPSASARAWASRRHRPGSRCTCCRSSRRTRTSSWGRRRRSSARRSPRRA